MCCIYQKKVQNSRIVYFSISFILRLSDEQIHRERRSLGETFVRMPGTNWCGGGWRAKSFNHLGAYGPSDKCCRYVLTRIRLQYKIFIFVHKVLMINNFY